MPASHTTNTPPELERALGAAGEKEFRRLCRAIRMARGSFFLFPIESDFSNPLRDVLLERLRTHLAEVGCCLRVAALSRQQWDLFALNEMEEPVAPTDAIVLVGLEETPGIVSEPGAKPGRPPAVALLNRQREILHERIPAPFLVWCLPFVYEALIEHAPDFFDHFTGLFRFHSAVPKEPRVGSFETKTDETTRITSDREQEGGSPASLAFYEQQAAKYTEATPERARALVGLAAALWEQRGPDYPARLERARIAAEEALTILTPEHDAYEWGRAQNVFGNILSNLPAGNRTENLQRAIACYEAALRVYTEKEFPQNWAMTQNNLGLAYGNLLSGDRGANLARAIACYEAALRVRTEKEFPYDYARTQVNVARAYEELGRWKGRQAMQRAANGYRRVGVETEAKKAEDWLKKHP